MAIEIDGKWWLEIDEVARLERITRREVYRRTKPGDEHPLIGKLRRSFAPESALRTTGRERGLVVYARSMTDDAQERFKAERLQALTSPDSAQQSASLPTPIALNMPASEGLTTLRNSGAGPAPGEKSAVSSRQEAAGQLRIWPQTELDRKIAALDVPEQQRAVILGRFRIIRPLVNHDYKALGYASKTKFITEMKRQAGVSRNTLWRWYWDYMKNEDLSALANERPGPEAMGAGSQALDASMRAFIKGRWLGIEGPGLPNKKQICRELIQYLTEKQRGCGVSYAYQFPSETTVNRFIDELDALDQARRQGSDAVKAALGYIDRTYTDLHSLERVETDEWKADIRAYDERKPRIVRRWWLLTFYDARSTYPLCWDLVAGNEYDVRHGICQEDEINLLVRLIQEYGVPGGLHSDRGRFRGLLFGGRPLHEKIDEVFAQANGILDQLGIRRNLPREKNPRGTRLERFHRYLADCCRTLPGWIGSNTRERAMAPGDAQEAEHLEFVDGHRATTPLLSRAELLEKIGGWMEAWRDHESQGTDMRGLSPRAVFVHSTPPEGFRKISAEELAWVTAQHFPNETIAAGGIVQLPDGKRYSHPLLTLIAGERRECVRLRDDHSLIKVLPARKGEEPILALARGRVGANDPEVLAREMELQKRLRKLAGSFTQRRTLEGALDHESAGQVMEAALAPPELAEERDDLPEGIELDGQIIHPRTFFED